MPVDPDLTRRRFLLAALATARAAGVPVTVVDGDDLLASGGAVTAIAEADASCTLLLGPVLAAQPEPEWAVRAAASGWQLPGGGQRMFPHEIRHSLELLDERRFGNGMVFVRYAVRN